MSSRAGQRLSAPLGFLSHSRSTELTAAPHSFASLPPPQPPRPSDPSASASVPSPALPILCGPLSTALAMGGSAAFDSQERRSTASDASGVLLASAVPVRDTASASASASVRRCRHVCGCTSAAYRRPAMERFTLSSLSEVLRHEQRGHELCNRSCPGWATARAWRLQKEREKEARWRDAAAVTPLSSLHSVREERAAAVAHFLSSNASPSSASPPPFSSTTLASASQQPSPPSSAPLTGGPSLSAFSWPCPLAAAASPAASNNDWPVATFPPPHMSWSTHLQATDALPMSPRPSPVLSSSSPSPGTASVRAHPSGPPLSSPSASPDPLPPHLDASGSPATACLRAENAALLADNTALHREVQALQWAFREEWRQSEELLQRMYARVQWEMEGHQRVRRRLARTRESIGELCDALLHLDPQHCFSPARPLSALAPQRRALMRNALIKAELHPHDRDSRTNSADEQTT